MLGIWIVALRMFSGLSTGQAVAGLFSGESHLPCSHLYSFACRSPYRVDSSWAPPTPAVGAVIALLLVQVTLAHSLVGETLL